MSEWHSIETAPKDGTIVDLWVAGPHNAGNRQPDCWFSDAEWWCDFGDQGEQQPGIYIGDVPTHWMPLPEPPK